MDKRGYKGGDECDAFSRRLRRIIVWRRGELREIKKAFSRRFRRAAKQALNKHEDT